MVEKSVQPRKQRKRQHQCEKHQKRKLVSAHLGPNYLHHKENKYWYLPRSIPIRKGDTVKILRGSNKGHSGKVAKVDLKKGMITVEGATLAKADGKQIPKWINASNVCITKLDRSDKRRNKKLKQLLEEEEEE
jgi:large subunit ribosomal protein L24